MSDSDGGSNAVTAEVEFKERVAPILGGANGMLGACGACHAVAGGVGPAFMLPNPDMLTTLLAYPGIIGPTPERSRLYAKGAHLGPAFTATEAPIVSAWIEHWNREHPMNGGGVDGGTSAMQPKVEPFAPSMGANTIDLSVLGANLAGATVTFDATLVGTVVQSLHLANIKINTPSSTGLHIVHPVWVLWPEGQDPAPDPVDSFASIDQTVGAGASAIMGTGLVLLSGYASNTKLSLIFVTIEAKSGSTPSTGCKNVASFSASVRPILQQSCAGCHAGPNNGATVAYDLRGIANASPESQANVCNRTLGTTNLATPTSSALLRKPEPGSGVTHPFKFNANDFANFRQAAEPWIVSER